MMTSLVIGASRGLGKSICMELANQKHDLIICSRDLKSLKKIKNEIERKTNSKVLIESTDLSRLNIEYFFKKVSSKKRNIENLFLIAGKSCLDLSGYVNTKEIDEILNINFFSLMKIVNNFLKINNNFENIVFASSVACSRPRARNGIYSTAKIALESYLTSIQHFLAKTKTKVQIYRLGYMDTDMTKGQDTMLPKANPDFIAKKIINNLNKKTGIIYLPFWWYFIKLIFTNLPWFVFKRLDL